MYGAVLSIGARMLEDVFGVALLHPVTVIASINVLCQVFMLSTLIQMRRNDSKGRLSVPH